MTLDNPLTVCISGLVQDVHKTRAMVVNGTHVLSKDKCVYRFSVSTPLHRHPKITHKHSVEMCDHLI